MSFKIILAANRLEIDTHSLNFAFHSEILLAILKLYICQEELETRHLENNAKYDVFHVSLIMNTELLN